MGIPGYCIENLLNEMAEGSLKEHKVTCITPKYIEIMVIKKRFENYIRRKESKIYSLRHQQNFASYYNKTVEYVKREIEKEKEKIRKYMERVKKKLESLDADVIDIEQAYLKIEMVSGAGRNE